MAHRVTSCLNCGALPEGDRCPYCGTLEIVAGVNHIGWEQTLTALREAQSEYTRLGIAANLRGRITAGQARALLALFVSEEYRLSAARILWERVDSPRKCSLACTSVFMSPPYQLAFRKDVVGSIPHDPVIWISAGTMVMGAAAWLILHLFMS